MLGVRKSTNLDAIYGDLGRYPMKVHRKTIAIIYWIKILKLNNNVRFLLLHLMLNSAQFMIVIVLDINVCMFYAK